MKKYPFSSLIMFFIICILFLVVSQRGAYAFSHKSPLENVNEAAIRLVQFCIDPKVGLDEKAVATIVDYVLSSKPKKEHVLPKSMDCTGAYYEFDTKISFPLFMEYSYNPNIPSSVTRPSSLRYSFWAVPRGEVNRLTNNWKPIHNGSEPIIIHDIQRESDTPDLTTGVYHEYDLKRTLIMLNHNGRQVLISISKQISRSNVGKQGIILGNDNEWNYFYSGKTGSSRTGLGWVKSYIYDYFSVGVYTESGAGLNMVRAGVFQWLRAGWSGINFVKSNHIIEGMKRFARDCRTILESPRLPTPNQLVCVYQWFSNLPKVDLIKKYSTLQQAQRSLAVQTGKISKSEAEKQTSYANIPKEQMIEELMVEYLKMTLGKPTPLLKQSLLFSPICKM